MLINNKTAHTQIETIKVTFFLRSGCILTTKHENSSKQISQQVKLQLQLKPQDHKHPDNQKPIPPKQKYPEAKTKQKSLKC